MRLPLYLTAFTLLPLPFAGAQTSGPVPDEIINQQALDQFKTELRDMKIPQIDTTGLVDPKALAQLQSQLRDMKIPRIDGSKLINQQALDTLVMKTAGLSSNPTLMALQMEGPLGEMGGGQMGGPGGHDMGPGSEGFGGRHEGGREGRIVPPGMWWKNPDLAQKLNITADQQKHMDSIVLESRIQLVQMKATLEEQELRLEPLLNANPPDTSKAMAQIDHIADTRANLEKANAKMLLSIRGVLTAQQWTQLQSEQHHSMGRMMRQDGPHQHDGPDQRQGRPQQPPTPPTGA